MLRSGMIATGRTATRAKTIVYRCQVSHPFPKQLLKQSEGLMVDPIPGGSAVLQAGSLVHQIAVSGHSVEVHAQMGILITAGLDGHYR